MSWTWCVCAFELLFSLETELCWRPATVDEIERRWPKGRSWSEEDGCSKHSSQATSRRPGPNSFWAVLRSIAWIGKKLEHVMCFLGWANSTARCRWCFVAEFFQIFKFLLVVESGSHRGQTQWFEDRKQSHVGRTWWFEEQRQSHAGRTWWFG